MNTELLEKAAKVMGKELFFPFGKNGGAHVRWTGIYSQRDTSDEHGALKEWNPSTSGADRDEIICKMRFDIDVSASGDTIRVIKKGLNQSTLGFEKVADHPSYGEALGAALINALAAMGGE